MAAALERESLEKLCSGETYEKAQAILRLAKAKTGPGTGFQVAHHNALPGICAYLASEEYASLPNTFVQSLTTNLQTE